MNFINTFQKIAKKNRKTVLTVACFILVVSAELSVTFIKKETKLINDLSEASNLNRVKVTKIETELDSHSLQLQGIVKRISFNDYIKHTDEIFSTLNSTNYKLLQSIGVLTGRVSGLEKIIYALNMYELRSRDHSYNDCKKETATER